MASNPLSKLPTELIIKIIGELRPENNKYEPIIGINSTWKNLPMFRASLQPDPVETALEGLQLFEEGDERPYTPSSPLLAFRATCSFYNELCQPFVFHELNIVYSNRSKESWDSCSPILRSHSQHIRSIRLLMNGHYDEAFSQALSTCNNLNSIGIYYDEASYGFISRIEETVVDLFEKESLKSFGIYWNRLLDYGASFFTDPDMYHHEALELLDAIARSPAASKAIVNLDIAVPSLRPRTYDLIRSQLTSLKSLTVRRGFRDNLPRIWQMPSASLWAPNPNLTRLQLISCPNSYAVHIPHLVRHFKNLEHLAVSTCGHWTDEIMPNVPSKERYTYEDAICKVRKPLKSFHMEHMEDWEIVAMGEIPTETLLFTNTGGEHLTIAFRADRQLFPHAQCVRLEDHTLGNIRGGSSSAAFTAETISALQEIFKERNIELRHDAEAMKPLPRHGNSPRLIT